MKDGKIHIKLDQNNEDEKRALEIMESARKGVTIKRYITEALLYYHDSKVDKERTIELLAEDISRHDKEIRRICRAIGLDPL